MNWVISDSAEGTGIGGRLIPETSESSPVLMPCHQKDKSKNTQLCGI
jgi:hypothetical protein